jgi:hypothetical protein
MPSRKSPIKTRQQKSRARPKDDCTIPGPVPSVALPRLKVRPDAEHEQRHVREYLEWQAPDEKVIHLEKVASERIFGGKFDVWDVHTDRQRWWVVTNPTNLYSQEHFPSLDYILSFHVGLMARVAAQKEKETGAGHAERERLLAPWRRWEQAAQLIDVAEEAEDFQAIGMRCRECLVELAQGAADLGMVQPGQEAPKRADFVHWMEIIAGAIAHGSSSEEVRGYIKTSAKVTWQFVNWLTHAKNAIRADSQIALDGTAHVLTVVGTALIRHEQGAPERCPECSSYQVVVDSRPDLSSDEPYVSLCARCGWSSAPRSERAEKGRKKAPKTGAAKKRETPRPRHRPGS